MSGSQAVGVVFSAAKARETKRRFDRLLRALVPAAAAPGEPPSVARTLGGFGSTGDSAGDSARDAARRLAVLGDEHDLHRYEKVLSGSLDVSFLCQDAVLDWVITRSARPTEVKPVAQFVDQLAPRSSKSSLLNKQEQPLLLFRCADFRAAS